MPAQVQITPTRPEGKEGRAHTLNRQVGAYAVARGLPGIINFLSLAIYTRLLGPEAFGEYALAISAISLLSTVGFYWLDLGLVRLYPKEATQRTLLATILRAFAWASAISTVAITAITFLSSIDPYLSVIGIVLLVAQGWHNLQLQLYRSQLAPRRFAGLSLARALIAPVVSSVLIYLGMGAKGLLLGLAAGALLPTLPNSRTNWEGSLAERPSKKLTHELLSYGAPLTLIFALRFVVNSSDRFMIAHFFGAHVTGVYSAATELAGNSLGFLTSIIQLAAFPLIVSSFEKGGSDAASPHLTNNIVLLLTVTLPATTGLALLAPQVSNIFFSAEFAHEASTLIPWIAAGTLIAMIKSVGFDIAFHLTRRTTVQLIVVMLAAGTNVLLNLILIPNFGPLGAAQATIITHALALAASLILGRSLIRLPFPVGSAFRIAASTATMALLLLVIRQWEGLGALILQILIGIVAFVAAGLLFDIPGLRAGISQAIRRGKSHHETAY